MTPIENSPIKEGFRQNNENAAREEERQIRQRLSSQLSALKTRQPIRPKWFCIAGAVAGILVGVSASNFFAGLLIGLGAGIGAWALLSAFFVRGFNADVEKQRQQLQSKADAEVAACYARADEITRQQIAAYDAEVREYAQRIMRNADNLAPMVQNVYSMLERMISHADHRPHMRFIEADLIYQVIPTGVKYSYLSRYTNPQDDYIFNVARYHDLSRPSECEGLAEALAKLTIKKAKSTQPADSFNIAVSHIDAQVTLHYKGANRNFVPGRDIY